MRTLVAGVGNVFLRDDGFGVEVVKQLVSIPAPPDVRIMDVGIRGIHLAHELLDGYDALVLIDAIPSGEPAGTVSVIELEGEEDEALAAETNPIADAHGFDPQTTLSMVKAMGGNVGRVFVVGCAPQDVSEGIGLSQAVSESIPGAVETTLELVNQLRAEKQELTH